MKIIKVTLLLLIALEPLESCLMLPCARTHYFKPVDSSQKDNPSVSIFSTPKSKTYIVQNTKPTTEVSIASPALERPDEFRLMENKDTFQSNEKRYAYNKRDRAFYKDDAYQTITLKLTYNGEVKIVTYRLVTR